MIGIDHDVKTRTKLKVNILVPFIEERTTYYLLFHFDNQSITQRSVKFLDKFYEYRTNADYHEWFVKCILNVINSKFHGALLPQPINHTKSIYN